MNSSDIGIVIRSTGSWVEVQTADRVIRSRIRGRFRLRGKSVTNPVAVGDQVTLRVNEDDTGLITKIHDRRNQLSRRAAGRRLGYEHVLASNIDTVWIIQSICLPPPNTAFIDRVLVTVEAQEVEVGIVLNKTDLAREEDLNKLTFLSTLYRRIGYDVLRTSATTGDGMDTFRMALTDQTNVFMGPSGVGKSTLLNMLEPELNLRAGSVSKKTRKGRHTTAHAVLLPLSGGGFVIDTPGVREFGVLDLEPWELSHHFPEFRQHLQQCRFPACTHQHEPACAVKEAHAMGIISDRRYQSYLNILHSIRSGKADVGR